MGQIADLFRSAWREYATDGVPSSGANNPKKADIRGIGAVIETELDQVRSLISAGAQWKDPVRVATTGSVTLATDAENGDTIDGVVLATGDRILVKDQVVGSTNGIYVVAASGAPTRSTDADAGSELLGLAVFVKEGTGNGGKQFVCTNTGVITVGSTALTFRQISDQTALNATVATAKGTITKNRANVGILAGLAPNLFDWTTQTLAGQSVSSTGTLTADANFFATDYIAVEAGATYSFTRPAATKRFAFYDASKTFISAVLSGGTFVTPAGTAYIRGSMRYADVSPENFAIVKGNELPGLASRNQPQVAVNLFNKDNITVGSFLSHLNNLNTNSDNYVSDYMPVLPGKTYYWSNLGVSKYINWFRSDFSHISGSLAASSATAPADAAYARISPRFSEFQPSVFMFTEGPLPSTYQPYAGYALVSQIMRNRPNGFAGLDENGQVPVSVLPASGSSPLSGKRIAGLGDSITYGFIPRNAPGYPGQLESFLARMSEQLGATALNYGISGSTLGDNGTGENSPMASRFGAMSDDADLVILMGGTNDVRKGVPLGAMGDTTIFTFYGALDVLARGLLNKYRYVAGGENRVIVFATPIRLLDTSTADKLHATLPSYCQAVKDVAKKYAIPVFDAYNASGLTPELFRTLTGTEPGYTENYNIYVTDGTHPTQEGHEIFARAWAGFIRTLY